MMSETKVKVLLVEDNADHAELARRSIITGNSNIALTIVDGYVAARQWLRNEEPDLLISDLNLPDGRGLDFLRVDKLSIGYPVLLITSISDEHLAVEAIKGGAMDYIVKRPETYRDLPHTIQRVLNEWELLIERTYVEQSLRESELKYRSIFENSILGILHFDFQGCVTACNQRLTEMIGMPAEKLVGSNLTQVPDPQMVNGVRGALQGESARFEMDYRSIITGAITPVRILISPVMLSADQSMGGIILVEDVSQERQADRLRSSVFYIAEAANTSTSLQQLYSEIHKTIQGLLPAKNFYIALYNAGRNEITFPYYVDEYDQNPGVIRGRRGMTEYLIRTGKPILVNPETFAELEAAGEVENSGTPSVDWLGVPLRSIDKKVFGALVVQSYTEGLRYSAKDVDILTYVSSQVASAIQRRQSEVAEHEQRLLAEALLDIASALNGSLELNKVFERILSNLERLCTFDAANIALIESDGVHTHYRRGRVDGRQTGRLVYDRKRLPTFKQILKTGKPMFIGDTHNNPDWVVLPGNEWIISYAGIPLRTKGKVIGFLNLNSAEPHAFDPAYAARMQAFADQAAMAIENARLYEEVQRLAIIDDLTGLFNRRGLMELGKREVERSIRFHRPLSALFMDIDLFKLFNDQHSYAVGDQILQLLASCLKNNLREIDVVSRYGGDEFVVLLPETDGSSAMQTAERLRRAVADLVLNSGGQDLRITISMGVASRQGGELDLETLIATAGDLLHIAKNRGKNQVAVG